MNGMSLKFICVRRQMSEYVWHYSVAQGLVSNYRNSEHKGLCWDNNQTKMSSRYEGAWSFRTLYVLCMCGQGF